MINKEQIQEWVDSPVTITLWHLCSRELRNVQDIKPVNCLFRGDPQKTQEQLVENTTKEFEWITFLALLKGRFQEHLGDLQNYHKEVEDEGSDEDDAE